MTKAQYSNYLRSEHWKTISRLVKERDGDRCVICNSVYHLNAHHRTYERCPYNERMEDLVTLCGKCHTMVKKELERRKD